MAPQYLLPAPQVRGLKNFQSKGRICCMQDRLPKNYTEVFDELVSRLESDTGYADELVELDARFIVPDALAINPDKELDRPHLKVSIDEVSDILSEAFLAICKENYIDPQDPDDIARHHDVIITELTQVLYSLRDIIHFGDIIGVSSGCILDISENGSLIAADEHEVVYGVFTGISIGQVPGEMQRIMGDYSGEDDFEIGVGLVFVNPIRTGDYDEVLTNTFHGNNVFIPLGLAGMELIKLSFTDIVPTDE